MANPAGGPPGPLPSKPTSGRDLDPRTAAGARRAVFGAGTAVNGQVAAREDLWIDGQVDGQIQARGYQVTIGAGARVRAEIKARSVVIEGELHGDVAAEEQVILRPGCRVHGDMRAPRVGLEEGCQFQGTVEMVGLPPEPADATADAAAPPGRESPPAPAAVASRPTGGAG